MLSFATDDSIPEKRSIRVYQQRKAGKRMRFESIIKVLISLMCMSGMAMACGNGGCEEVPPIIVPVVDCPEGGDTITEETNIQTGIATGNSEDSGDGSIAAGITGDDNEIETEYHEASAESEEGPAVAITDSPGADVEFVDIAETYVDETYIQTEEAGADAGDNGQAVAINGNGNDVDQNLVQIGTVGGDKINSDNTVTIFRDDSVHITNIDDSVHITNIDQSVHETTITNIDNSVHQTFINNGVNFGDIKFINVDGVQVPVEVTNVDGNVVVKVSVNIDGSEKEIKYVVKHQTTIVSGGNGGVVMAVGPKGPVSKKVVAGMPVINEFNNEKVEFAVTGPFDMVLGEIVVTTADGCVTTAQITDGHFGAGFYTVGVKTEGEIISVVLDSRKGGDSVFGSFSLLVGQSWSRYPDVTGQFFPAFASMGYANNAPMAGGVAVISAASA